MTVAHVVLTLDHGGLEHLVIQLSVQLQRRGIRSVIVVLTDGALVGEARRQGIDVFVLGKREGLDLTVIPRLARVLRRERADVVHSHNFAPLNYGTLAAKLCGLRTLNTRHGRAAITASRLIWALTDGVIAVSEDAKRELLAHNRIAAHKVHVVLNAVDTTVYRERRGGVLRRIELGLPEGVPIVGTVGRLSPEKDHATLLEAVKMMRDAGSTAHLAIVGGGPLEAALTTQVEALGLQESVHMLGFRTDVPAVLSLLDVYVLPSRMEGVSLTLLEAMSAGLPVVATRVGGNPEVVVEGATGLLVEPGEPRQLAAALQSLLGDEARRLTLGADGRRRVDETFSMERFVDAHVQLYERLRAG